MKRIIYCADGTWDTAINGTNVYRLFKALRTTPQQLPFYDDGVGADGNPLWRLVGGAFGTGLWQKIKAGYTAIAHVYEAGDQIYLFGFSRGAFTARSLGGMIAVAGLPTANFDDLVVELAFNAYRDVDDRAEILASLSNYKLFDAKITMVGVWDTVGSLGIPALVGKVDPILYGFLDTGLHPDVLNAYQALAIDERRTEFPATLWTSAPTSGQTIEQVWFAGVHCDIGGGYPETGLSEVTLSWMMNRAKALGVEFDDAVVAQLGAIDAKHALDVIHESWSPIWLFPTRRPVDTGSRLANSVGIRFAHDASYRPPNLHQVAGQPDGYTIVNVVADLPVAPGVAV
jgi:uncharacterized protein (DUF2235 family)